MVLAQLVVASMLLPMAQCFIKKNALPPLEYSHPQNSSVFTTRDQHGPATHKYFTSLFDSVEDAKQSIKNSPGAVLIGRVGELANAYLAAIPIVQLRGSTHTNFDGWTLLSRKKWEPRNTTFNDPVYNLQYHLNATGLNATYAWNNGTTGSSSTIVFLDDGFDTTSLELLPHYVCYFVL